MESHALFTQLKTIKDKIIWLLAKHPETQDDDKLLYGFFVIYSAGKGNFDAGKKYLESLLAIELVNDIENHNYVNYASLVRQRKLTQAKMEHLRGKLYDKRQLHNPKKNK
jgi:hypothetical protein